MTKPIKIKAKTFWASLTKPNELSGKFQVDISNLSQAAVKALEDLGLEIKNKGDERQFFITCKSNHPIRAYDKNGNELKNVLVGNGSEVTCTIGTYDWKFKNKKGTSASILKLVVDELKEYGGDAESVDGGDGEEELKDSLDEVL